MSNKLTACFSATGVTRKIACEIATIANSDFFEIIPVPPYSGPDLDWNDKQSRSSLEMADKTSRPAIKDQINNISTYSTIFLGFPIWWYEAPRIIQTFLESYDFNGKVIIPFATSGGSGLGSTEEILKKTCPKAIWKPGLRFPGNASKEMIENG